MAHTKCHSMLVLVYQKLSPTAYQYTATPGTTPGKFYYHTLHKCHYNTLHTFTLHTPLREAEPCNNH